MDKEKYLVMDAEQLREDLIADILIDPSEGRKVVQEIKGSDRYHKDPVFKAYIDSAWALIMGLFSNFSKMIPISMELIERTQKLGLYELTSLNWNLVGNSYYQMNVPEKALESFYYVIRIEDRHGSSKMKRIAYNNIALIYLHLKDHEKALRYLDLTLAELQRQKTSSRYHSLLTACLSSTLEVLLQLGRMEDAEKILHRLQAIDERKVTPEVMVSYRTCLIDYYFAKKDYEEAKRNYQKARELVIGNGVFPLARVVHNYVRLCREARLEYGYYIEDLLYFEELEEVKNDERFVELYRMIREYYLEIEDREKQRKVDRDYIALLEKNDESLRKRQLDSLNIVDDLVKTGEDLVEVETKNTELRKIAEEAIRHKQELQDTYHRIEIINRLGRTMTASLDLAEVVDAIYRNLKENIPLDNFLLMVGEPEHGRLRSLVFYNDDELFPEVSIPLDDPNSLMVSCYKSGQPLFSGDVENDDRFKALKPIRAGNSGSAVRSVIFMPLIVGEQTIGVFSIQNLSEAIYTPKHIEFLEELLPYLSIALNNAVRSWTLESEIRSHLKTQQELKRANKKLSRLSSLDGLTRIGNRRIFEEKILAMLEQSEESGAPIAIYMIDIDDFKRYNDTYGHLEGDEVLKKVAKIVQAKMDDVNGLSARFGGEEFVAATSGYDRTNAFLLGEEIRKEVYSLAIENRMTPLGQISISIGIALSSGASVSQKSMLMRWADVSLYQAKHSGKNKVVLKEVHYDGEAFVELEHK